jgi:polysaccharide pyruvyl transferase CsaB
MPGRDRSRIVLLGWYCSNNTGDEALAEVIVQQLKKHGFDDLVALSTNPGKTASRLGISSTSRSLLNRGAIQAISGAKALILGGGGLIQDGTSVYNLPIYTAYVVLARLFGVKVIGWGLGAEPLWTLLGRLQGRFICNVSAHFSVRDTLSKRLLLRAGASPDRAKVTADPAILLGANPLEEYLPDDGRPTIIFCIRHLPVIRPGLNIQYVLPVSVRHRFGIEWEQNDRRTEGLVEAIARGIRVATQELGARVVLLPLWPGRDDEMLDIVEQAAIKLGVPHDAMQRAQVGDTPGSFAAYVGKADLLVSMRLHALVFAAAQGVPMLALSYARKVRGFMRDLGFERWVVEVETRTPPPEELEMKLRQLWAMRHEEGDRLRKAVQRAQRRAEADGEEIARLLGCEEKR